MTHLLLTLDVDGSVDDPDVNDTPPVVDTDTVEDDGLAVDVLIVKVVDAAVADTDDDFIVLTDGSAGVPLGVVD